MNYSLIWTIKFGQLNFISNELPSGIFVNDMLKMCEFKIIYTKEMHKRTCTCDPGHTHLLSLFNG